MILIVMARAEGKVDWMVRMRKEPTGVIAFDDPGMAVAHVATAEEIKRRARIERQFEATFETSEIESRLMSRSRRRKRVVEVIAYPQLIAGDPSYDPYVRSDGLLELKALLHGSIILAAEAAAEENCIQNLRTG